MKNKLHIDFETYSSEDIAKVGHYKYMESPDFEIMLAPFALNDDPVQCVDLYNGEEMPQLFWDALRDPEVILCAHNAAFERKAIFEQWGIDIPPERWECTQAKAMYCGLPASLGDLSVALKLEYGKMTEGKKLIDIFCKPIKKPTKSTGYRARTFSDNDPVNWYMFKKYAIRDVEAEREVGKRLSRIKFPEMEQLIYCLDQRINDRGVRLDLNLARNAAEINDRYKEELSYRMKKLSGVENPNSGDQVKKWIKAQTGRTYLSLTKDTVPEIQAELGECAVSDFLDLLLESKKTSVSKYSTMLRSASFLDERGRGYTKYYGAGRTGRFAGRIVQLQNLPKNVIDFLDEARKNLSQGGYQMMKDLYGEKLTYVLSQLLRTAIIPKDGHVFAPADFSAIEARVLAWLAGEQWRIDVFNGDGKIYETSASRMFKVPLDQCQKKSGTDYRSKGKVAELALGYQGSVGAMRNMAKGELDHVPDDELRKLVNDWREASPMIVELWDDMELQAMKAMRNKGKWFTSSFKNISFLCTDEFLTIKLPSGRQLYYRDPKFGVNQWGSPNVTYMGVKEGNWVRLNTYGGKLVENIVQAIARDILCDSMLRLEGLGFEIVFHVHDEAIPEIPEDGNEEANMELMCEEMGKPISWAKGLPLKADGYLTKYYKKDDD